jgi:hypothetical protein
VKHLSIKPPKQRRILNRAKKRDVLRFPSRQFDIDTELSQAEVVERVRAIVEPRSAFLAAFNRTNKLFAGDVSSDGFKIRRLKYYPNPHFPVVIGRFEPLPVGTRVNITMRLRRFMQAFIVIWSAAMVFACVAPFLLALPSSTKNGVSFFVLFTPLEWIGLVMGGISFAYLVAAVSFGVEARKARGLVEEALQPAPGSRVQRVLEGVRPRLPRVAKFLLVCAAAAIAMMVGIQSFMAGSEPFHVAEGYVHSDPLIRSELGAIDGVDLDRWKSAHIEYVGSDGGAAMFALRVAGSRRNGVVFVQMRKHRGVWRVSSANLREADGRVVDLQADAASAETRGTGR